MAILLPDTCPRASQGVQTLYRLLREALPDEFTAWYEPACGPAACDFIVVSPAFGLVLLDVRNWYPKHLLAATETELRLQDGDEPTAEPHPLHRLRERLTELCQRFVQVPALRDPDAADRPRLPVGRGLVLSNVTRAQLAEKGLAAAFPAGPVLCKDELEALAAGRSDRDTLRAFRAMLLDDRPFESLGPDEMSALRGVLHPDTVVRGRSRPPGDDEPPADVLGTFDRHQEQVARNLGDGHRVVAGVAGSGKTILLLHRARMLAEDPNRRVLVLCYNRVLGNHLADQLRPTHPAVEVYSFHAWARQLTRLTPAAGEAFDVYEQRLLAALSRTLELAPTADRYDAVLVDEAHDFDPAWLRLVVQALKDRQDGHLLLAVDGAQSLYGRRRDFTWKSVGIRAQGRSQRLTANYRNTREVLRFAWELTQADLAETDTSDDEPIQRLRPEEGRRSGPPPECWPCRGFREENETLQRLVVRHRERGVPPEQIAVLYARQEGKRIADLAAALGEVGEVCWVNDPKARTNRDHAHRLPGVRVSTIHSAKGLEYPVVLVCALDQLPDANRTDAVRDANLLYVGLTRATESLALTWVGQSGYTRRALELTT